MKFSIAPVLIALAVSSVRAGDPAILSSKESEKEAMEETTKMTKTSSGGIGSLYEDGYGGIIADDSGADEKAVPKLFSLGSSTLGPAPAVPISRSGSLNSGHAPAGKACPEICTMQYSPVKDENGVEYSNSCEMRKAKCKSNRMKTIDFSTVFDEDLYDS